MALSAGASNKLFWGIFVSKWKYATGCILAFKRSGKFENGAPLVNLFYCCIKCTDSKLELWKEDVVSAMITEMRIGTKDNIFYLNCN